MKRLIVASVAIISVVVAGVAFAGAPKKAASVTQEQAQTAVAGFVNAMNSLKTDNALATVTAGDRMALKGKDDTLGLIYENKLVNPKVTGVESVHEGNRLVGAKVNVQVEEVDPLDATRVPKKYTWYLVKEGGDLKVSVLSLWLAKQEDE